MKKIFFALSFSLFASLSPAQMTFEWANSIGGNKSELITGVAVDPFGNVFVTGMFADTADVDPGPGVHNLIASSIYHDIFIVKYSPSGGFLWAAQITGPSDEWPTDITSDTSGNIIVTGYFAGTIDFDPGPGTANLSGPASLASNAFILKLDNSGSLIWAKQFYSTNTLNANSIALDPSGNILVAGQFLMTVDFDPGPGTANLSSTGGGNVYVCKLDANGNYLWASHIGGPLNESLIDMKPDVFGNVYLTGTFDGTADFDPSPTSTHNLTPFGTIDAYLCKLDPSGNFSWVNQIAGTNDDLGFAIGSDATGNIYNAGHFWGTIDLDPSSAVANFTATGGGNTYVTKFDNSGNYIWGKTLTGGNIVPRSVFAGTSGEVLLTGEFMDTVDFDPGVAVSNLTSAGLRDIFISKLDASGNYLGAKQMGDVYEDYGQYASTDNSGNLYLAGSYNGTVDFDPTSGVYSLSSVPATGTLPSQDVYTVKLSNVINGIHERANYEDFLLLPNPTSDRINLEIYSKENSEIEIEIYSIAGQLLKIEDQKLNVGENRLPVNVSGLSNGIYILKTNKGHTSRFVINGAF